MPAPRRIEAILWLLLPPACREYVLGDLCEKCDSTREYVVEGVRVLPPVIRSRIRRTTDPQLFLMEVVSLYLSFSTAAWYLGQQSFLYAHFGFARLAVPSGVAITGLLLCNAWSDPQRRSFLKPILQTAGSIAFALAGQALIFDTCSYLSVPSSALLGGAVLAFLLVSTLRAAFQPSGVSPSKAILVPIDEISSRKYPQEPEQNRIRPAARQASTWLVVIAAALLAVSLRHASSPLDPRALLVILFFLAYWIKSR